MKKLVFYALIFVIGVGIGYIYGSDIDSKLKSKLGSENVESLKEGAKETIDSTGQKATRIGKAGYEAMKDEATKEN